MYLKGDVGYLISAFVFFGSFYLHNQDMFSFLPVLFSLLLISDFNPESSLQSDTLHVVLDDVRIEAARLTETRATAPFSVFRIEQDASTRSSTPGLTLDESLRTIPGLWINDRNNFALGERLSVRGMGWRAAFGVRGVFILMDGIPLTMPDGQAIMSLIDPAFIREAELIRGPSSVFWGNAGGGALLLSTRSRHIDPYARVRFTAGSFGMNKTEFEAGFLSGGNRFMIYGSRLYQDGFREHSRFEAFRLGGHAEINTGNNSIMRLTGAFLESPTSDNPGSLNREQAALTPDMANPANVNQNARKMTRHGQAGVQYRVFGEDYEWNVNTWGLARRLQNPLSFAWIQVDRLAGGAGSTYRQEFADFELGAGLDVSAQSDSRRNWTNNQGNRGQLTLDQQEQVFNVAGFSRIRVPFGDFAVSAGLRADWLEFRNTDRFFSDGENSSGDRQFWSLSPMAGVTYQWNNWLGFLNFSTGFESPTTTELVNRPDMTGGFNPDLQPERTYSVETGFRGGLHEYNLEIDAAVFFMQVRDLMLPFRTADGGDRDFYENLGSTMQQGFELYMRWAPLSMLDLVLNYGYNQFKFSSDEILQQNESLKENHLPGIPNHQLSGTLGLRHRNILLRVEGQYSGSYYVNNLNTEQNDSWFVVNLNLSAHEIPLGGGIGISPFIQINNVLDESYNGSVIINAFGGRYYEPAPGRNFAAGLSVRI